MKKALIQLHSAVFLAGFTGILGKLIGLNEGLLVWYRVAITVVTLGALLFFMKVNLRIELRDLFKLFGIGAIVVLHWVTFYASIKYANVSVALVCFSATGFFTSLFEPLVLWKRMDVAEVLLGLFAIAGIYIIFNFNPEYKTGIIFGIICAMGSAIFPIFNKEMLKRIEPKALTFYEMAGGLITLTLLVPFYVMKFPADYYVPTQTDWYWLLVLAWFCTVLSFILSLNALKKISAFTVNLSYNLEPVYGILLAFIFFRENKDLKSTFYIGVGLIILAVVLQMFREYQKMKSSTRIHKG